MPHFFNVWHDRLKINRDEYTLNIRHRNYYAKYILYPPTPNKEKE